MRSLAVYSALVSAAIGLAACGGGAISTNPVTPAAGPPAATTASQTVTFPTAPTTGNTVTVSLPSPGGIAPAFILGPGYSPGTQLVVSAENFGQTSSVKRATASTFAACPVLVDLSAYASLPLPGTAIAGFSVAYGSVLSFVGSGTFTADVYDAGVASQTTGTPPAPAEVNGCATAPASTTIIASATGSVASGVVTFTNFQINANLSSALQTKYGVSAGNNITFPAGAVFGVYVAFVASATPAPTASPSSTPSPAPTSSATAGPTSSPTIAPTSSPTSTPSATPTATPSPTTLATATLLGSLGFVAPSGRTAYVLSDDTTTSLACTVGSGCTGVWPPISPPAGVALSTGFTVFTRSDNSAQQLAYNNHPLYNYAGDSAAGTANGNGLVSFGGTWSVARP